MYKRFCSVYKAFILLILMAAAFLGGAMTYKEGLHRYILNAVFSNTTKAHGPALLPYAFSAPLASDTLYYGALTTREDIRTRNEAILMTEPLSRSLFNNLKVGKVDHYPDYARLSFSLGKNTYHAFTYGLLPKTCPTSKKSAALIIPGSGHNQSAGIYKNDPRNYHHGIMPALAAHDISAYVLIKPNEDVLAWHNGAGKKVGDDFIVNWHINQGGSYSRSYIVQALAVIKHLQNCYARSGVTGLSQGGQAAMVTAHLSRPDFAIIASGYSMIDRDAQWGGLNQIFLPSGIFADNIHDPAVFAQNPAQFLLTYGQKESGTYGVEARDRITCNALESLENVDCIIHEDGHIFPAKKIDRFLNSLETAAP